MGRGTSFQLSKVSRFIKLYGDAFAFERFQLYKYNEPIKDDPEHPPQSIRIRGAYHEVNSQVSFNTSEGTVTRTEPQPRILCMPVDGSKVKMNDEVTYKGVRYRVVDPANLGMQSVCIDISLEVVQNG